MVEHFYPGPLAIDLDDSQTKQLSVRHPPRRPCAAAVQVLDLLLRGEAGAIAAIRPRLEPLAIGIERRVPFGDSEDLPSFAVAAVASSAASSSKLAIAASVSSSVIGVSLPV
jgi:hypothetical protein